MKQILLILLVLITTEVLSQQIYFNKNYDFGEQEDIYPNPAQNRVTFQHRLPKGKEAVLEVYDLQGKLMKNWELKVEDEALELDIEAWESGLYLYRVRIEGREVSSRKLVVE